MERSVYCDAIAGELIFVHRIDNKVAEEFINLIKEPLYYRENHIRVIESMQQKLGDLDLHQDTHITLQLYRLGIPEGQEVFKINWLLQQYNRFCIERLSTRPEDGKATFEAITNPPDIGVNAFYEVASIDPAAAKGSFTFTKTHEENLKIIHRFKNSAVNPKKKILIIDSGISSDSRCTVIDKRNFLARKRKDHLPNETSEPSKTDAANLFDVTDETGHGTAIASIIEDVLPGTELIVYKIVDKNGFSTEWDLLAALCALNESSIINVSLTYGLKKVDCNKCGRLTTEARSGVLEWVAAHLSHNNKLVVAAAGNKMLPSLSYPARLNQCVAIVSVNTQLSLSDFSNHSKLDQVNGEHPFIFSAPGGNKDPEEKIFCDYIRTEGLGTSFSSAYASAIICSIWSEKDFLSVKSLLEKIKKHYVIENQGSQIPGNGLLVFSQ